jgi:hypothetical protein
VRNPNILGCLRHLAVFVDEAREDASGVAARHETESWQTLFRIAKQTGTGVVVVGRPAAAFSGVKGIPDNVYSDLTDTDYGYEGIESVTARPECDGSEGLDRFSGYEHSGEKRWEARRIR